MIKEGLHPEIIIHPKSFELLRQWEVCEDHIVDLNSSGSVFSQLKTHLPEITSCPEGQLGCWPSNHVEPTCGLEGLVIDHWHCEMKIRAVIEWLFGCWVEK